jgi:hypothetical protein
MTTGELFYYLVMGWFGWEFLKLLKIAFSDNKEEPLLDDEI